MRAFTRFILILSITVSTLANDGQRKGKSLYNFLAPQQKSFDPFISNRLPSMPPNQQNDSPIYYIKLPPIPYTFIPGYGYVQQESHATNGLMNLPINFLANGKPSGIYRWSGAFDIPTAIPPPKQMVPAPLPDSPQYQLPGKFNFNGKVTDLYILKDPYNSLYEDTLQNIYP